MPAERSRSREWKTRVGLTILVGGVVFALLGPAFDRHGAAEIAPERALEPPSVEYPLGTDALGRCLVARLAGGARYTLGVTLAAGLSALLIGTLVGASAGFRGGSVDAAAMRVVDGILAFPALVPALAIVGMLGPGLDHLLVAIALVWWAGYARLVRALTVSIRSRPYVEAARALGIPGRRVLGRHVLPNAMPQVLVLASLDMGTVMLMVTAFGYLGLGVAAPTPEWGSMLNDGRAFLLTAPRLMILPGVAISIVALGFNLLGEGLRDRSEVRRGFAVVAGSAGGDG